MPIGGFLSHTAMGWKSIFYSMGVLTLITSVLWWGCTASCPSEHKWIKQNEKIYIENSLQSSGKVCIIPDLTFF